MAAGTLIHVTGAPFSGTTMLDLMLGNNQRAFSCGELYALYRPWRTHHFNPTCPCGADTCRVWADLEGVSEENIHAEIIRQQRVQFLIDSSKNLNWLVDSHGWASRRGMTVRTVTIWKDPLHFAYSDWKRSGSFTSWRRRYLDYYQRLTRLKLPFVAIEYEQLTAEPESALRLVCNAVGLPYVDGMERFWESQHHHLFGSLGTRKQDQAGASQIRPTIDFRPEFASKIDWLREKMASDTTLNALTGLLSANSVGAAGDSKPVNWSQARVRRLPPWYYIRRLKSRLRRHFPRESPPHFR